MNGSDKCRMHLGRKTAGVKLAYQAEQALARLDAPPVENALEELKALGGEAKAWKDAMAERVNELTSIRYSTDGGEQLRAEIALFERAMDRCEKILTSIARLNIDERLAAIEEAKVAALIALIDYAVEPLPEAERAVASSRIRAKLVEISGAA
ncbi:hypothetical protein [Actinomadura rupiterrae]|uniref:hypothetical protein n=1 Tax=Actinomadura rupiterrae TaxID=559627 RepID=UPI0020A3CEB3|nr:hypothetical protein [Actinomadura rupiterrae]MCP2336136.1 hypothetical protein [Actinomadura rupiterrae]